ncbi:MAG: hypothetical protein M1503_05935 [Thaumarchaeota archaeon]|nr:hypothetical protein [Nitrososphaerota archaeon]MCL5317784.1 hypothetical protein [Nitrososphaerota archaeon]
MSVGTATRVSAKPRRLRARQKRAEAGAVSTDKLQMIETLKAPIILLGKEFGYEVIENYDLGGGPIHVAWVFRPGSDVLPLMRLGFLCLTEFSEFSLNQAIARSLISLIDKLVIVVPYDSMLKQVKDSLDRMPATSMLQLRKYVTAITPSALVTKTGIEGADRRGAQTGVLV